MCKNSKIWLQIQLLEIPIQKFKNSNTLMTIVANLALKKKINHLVAYKLTV